MVVPSVSILLTNKSLLLLVWLCACTLATELIALKNHPRLPIPSAIDWPWGGESLNY
jgi:hypothetical protein